jgi:Holliday junction resolvase RusA-like endonuclease
MEPIPQIPQLEFIRHTWEDLLTAYELKRLLHLSIPGRPHPSKNSRITATATGRSFPSKAAREWFKQGRAALAQQHKGPPLHQPHWVAIVAVFKNRASLPDADNVINAVLDLLKPYRDPRSGLQVPMVVVDDSYRYLRLAGIEYRYSPQERVEVYLWPVTDR